MKLFCVKIKASNIRLQYSRVLKIVMDFRLAGDIVLGLGSCYLLSLLYPAGILVGR